MLDALREIREHPLRSLLTLTAIVFGAASVVSMTSLSAAIKNVAYDELERMGMPGTFELYDRGPRSDARRAADLRHAGIRLPDVEALRRLPGVEASFARNFTGRHLASTPLDQRTVPVDGIDAGYLRFRNWPIVRGREFAALDVRNGARVAVIGEELVQPFFGSADPIGRTILIAGIRFRVVGVVAPIELELVPADFSFLARRIYVPFTYLTLYHKGQGRVDNVLLKVADAADFPSVMQAGRIRLRQRHLGVEDFGVDNEAANVASDLAMAEGIATGWDAVLFTIAGVTLMVGGIGLFSILLISVRERVREIGIRKAVGADDPDIRRLFLTESLTLALLGATLGVGGGTALIVVTEAIAQGFGRNLQIPLHIPGAILAVIFALVVGFLFGWYPASRAAKLDPIEAIREL
ncbi:MAG: FtsX-like permease family protein [Gemmatimonadales bacterium]|nr:FtsX-like permease family protein [Gemmatimonadales bacterium]NIS64103.1 FtsX-like permease family protein [Gemmatimonadales bacterium]